MLPGDWQHNYKSSISSNAVMIYIPDLGVHALQQHGSKELIAL